MSTLTEMSAALQTAGIGTEGTSQFIGVLPMSPDNCVVLSSSRSGASVRGMGPAKGAPVADNIFFQVLVRNTSFSAGEAKVDAVLDALDHDWGTFGSTKYYYIVLNYGPIYLGQDENKRHMWTIDFHATKARS